MRVMTIVSLAAAAVAFSLLTACPVCGCGPPVGAISNTSVVNGFGAAVDVVADGIVSLSNLADGAVGVVPMQIGAHQLSVRPSATAVVPTQLAFTSKGPPVTIGILRASGGALGAQVLDDTNAVVPAGATKLRVLNLAANAGEVQVWRTQPDFMTPIRWAFPFTYNSVNTYYQSTPGTWEVRIWTDTITYAPGNPAGWSNAALDAMTVSLAAGTRGNFAIVDKPGGGVKLVRIE